MDANIQDGVITLDSGDTESGNIATESPSSVSSPLIDKSDSSETSETKSGIVHGQGLSWKRRINEPLRPKRTTTDSLLTRTKKQYSLYFHSVDNYQYSLMVNDLQEAEFDILCFPRTCLHRYYSEKYKVAYYTHKNLVTGELGAAILLRSKIQFKIRRDICYYDCDPQSGSKFEAACVEIERSKVIVLCVSADTKNPYHTRVLNHILKIMKCEGLIVCGNFKGNILVKARLKPVFGDVTDGEYTCLKSGDVFYQNCRVLHRDTLAEDNSEVVAMGIKFKK